MLWKTKHVITMQPSNYAWDIYPQEVEIHTYTETCIQIFIEALFLIAKN